MYKIPLKEQTNTMLKQRFSTLQKRAGYLEGQREYIDYKYAQSANFELLDQEYDEVVTEIQTIKAELLRRERNAESATDAMEREQRRIEEGTGVKLVP